MRVPYAATPLTRAEHDIMRRECLPLRVDAEAR